MHTINHPPTGLEAEAARYRGLVAEYEAASTRRTRVRLDDEICQAADPLTAAAATVPGHYLDLLGQYDRARTAASRDRIDDEICRAADALLATAGADVRELVAA